MSLAPLLLLLGVPFGCGTVGLDVYKGAGGGGGSGEEPAGLQIDGLEPAWAPLSGGTTVTVTGQGFEGEVRFWFGGSEVELTHLDDETLIVTSPEVFTETTVDVVVSSDLGELTVEDAFTFSDEPPPGDSGGGGDSGGDDGGDGGGDGGTDGGSEAGRTSGLIQLDYLVVGCPSCFGLTSNLLISASAALHEPVDGSWADWMPPNGGCALDPERGGPTESYLDAGGHLYLESGSRSIDLARSGSGSSATYLSDALSSSDYVRSAAYDLVVPAGGDLEAFTAEDALISTSGFDSLSPTAIWGDGSSAFPAFKASAASFGWTPTGVSDSVVIDIVVYSADGGSQLAEIICAADDTGAATVPSSAFSGLPVGALLAIYFYRWDYTATESPLDGSTLEGITQFGGIATGELRP